MTRNFQAESPSSQPIGYCPHCDYQLVAVGVCPECGNTSDSTSIRDRPRITRRRRALKRIAIGIAIIAALLGGRWFVGSSYFYRLWPNTLLIEAYPANLNATQELTRRMRVGRLWDDEVVLLVEKSFTQTLDIQSPRSAAEALVGDVTVQSTSNSLFEVVPNNKGEYLKPQNGRRGETALTYQKKTGSISSTKTTGVGAPTLTNQTISATYELASEVLPGEASVYHETVIQVKAADSKIDNVYSALVDRPFILRSNVTVVARDDSLSAFIDEIYSAEVEAAWRADVRVMGFKSADDTASIKICFGRRERPYFVRHEIETFGHEGERYVSTSGRDKLVFGETAYRFAGRLTYQFGDTPFVNVRVFADVAAARNDGQAQVNPIALEWHQLDVREFPASGDFFKSSRKMTSCDQDFAIAADVVRRLRPEEY